MSKSEFDDLLRKKLKEEELEYDPENWDRLSQLLPPALPSHSKKWTIGLGIAAALALLLATTLLVKLMDQTNRIQIPDRNLIARTQHEDIQINEPQIEPNNTPGSGPKIQVHEAAKDHRIFPTKQQAKGIEKRSNYAAASRPDDDETGVRKQTPSQQTGIALFTPGKQMTERNAKDIPNRKASEGNNILETHPVPPPFSSGRESLLRGQQHNMLAASSYDPPPSKAGSQTSVAFGGGVNYGSLNAGYSLNVTAQQKIGNHFFFDGTIAVMYNNNTPNNIVNYPGTPVPNNTAARPVQEMMLSTPAVAPVASLYYVQFNPSFGYQLADNLAISVGGDLQQMLSRDDELRKYQVTEEGTRVFPGLDLGFTGKTEYSITPEIQAGLLFREGLNNLIQPNQELPFVNRRYIQVQFKYNIPVRR
jgi:hypothetical protein